MSRVRPPQDEWARINDLERRINNMERGNPFQGAQASASDANGTARLVIGQVSPGVWGFALYDASSNKIIQLDSTGLSQYDTAGRLRVQAGHLGDGDYGLQVIDTAGNSQEILPAVQQYVSGAITVTSQSYISDGGPSVTAVVGASGKVRVDASLFAAANAGNVGAWVGLSVDGNAPTQDLVELDSAGGQITSDCGASVVVTGLTAGSHTFEMYYKWASATGSASFSRRSLIVTPI